MGIRLPALVVCLSLVSNNAFSQTLRDEFEGTQLLADTPPGVWNSRFSRPNYTMTQSTSAAREGDAGLHVVDTGGGPVGSAGYLENDATSSGDRYMRFWFRPLTGAGGPPHIAALSGSISNSTFSDVVWDPATNQLSVSCVRRNGSSSQYAGALGPVAVQRNTWHLVEFGTEGIGSSTGRCVGAIDGIALTPISNVNWSSLGSNAVFVGEIHRDSAFTGSYDFDNVAVSPTRLPSRLQLKAAGVGPVTQGSCETVTLTVRESFDGGAASVRQQTAISFATDGGADVHAGGCAAPTDPVLTLMTGVNTATVGIAFTQAGTVTLSTLSADYINDTLTYTVVPAADAGADAGGASDAGELDAGVSDAGSADASIADAGPSDAAVADSGVFEADAGSTPVEVPLSVGCGCSSGLSSGWAVLLLLGVFCSQRRRSVN